MKNTNQLLSDFQFFDKYSRFNYEKGRRETWEEAVDRSVSYLRELSENKLPEEDYNQIRKYMLEKKAFPSMRLFAMAGEAARRDNASIYNCSAIGIDSIDSMVEVMALCMSGCGVGFSVEDKYISKLPVVLAAEKNWEQVEYYTVPDTTDGWLNSFRYGLESWFDGGDIEFDYSEIRPAGSVLKIKGGRASGPTPLMELHDFSRKTIQAAVGRRLTSLEVHDIVTKIADCVVSGGVRRSALISLFDYNDEPMRHAKDNGWWKESPQRANANNSIVINKELSKEEISGLFMTMHEGGGGEPGWHVRKNVNKMNPERRTDRDDWLLNPCQPDFAVVLKKDVGEVLISELQVGDFIYSEDGWVQVVRMKNNGRKNVNVYSVDGYGVFIGTPDHKVKINEQKVEIRTAYYNGIPIPVLNEKSGEISYKAIDSMVSIGMYNVYSLTVDGPSHTYWTSGLSVCNCGEVNLRGDGQMCNLSQAITRPEDTLDSLAEKVKIASIIGTIQSTATSFPYLRSQWKENCEEERLLGVDVTGQLDAPQLFTPENLLYLKSIAVETNKKYAAILGVNESTAVTCNKPSGNSSLLFDCSPGLHSRWSDYYIRRFRVNAKSPLRYILEYSGMTLYPENGQQYDTASSLVVEFPVKSPDGAITNGSRTAVEQCEWWKMNKLYWTEHNPSVTILYSNDEINDVIDWLFNNQDIIGGMSFLPRDDHYYPLAPYEKITKEQYEEMIQHVPEIDWEYLLPYFENEDNTTIAQELACMSGTCEI